MKLNADPVMEDLRKFNCEMERQDAIDKMREDIESPIMDALLALKSNNIVLDLVIVHLQEAIYQAEYFRHNNKL